MKIGTENRNKTIIAAVLMLVALVLVVRMATAPSTSSASPAAPKSTLGTDRAADIAAATAPAADAQQGRRPKPATTTKRLSAKLTPTLDPRLRLDLLKVSEDVSYKGSGRDIFSGAPEIEQPIAKARIETPAPQPQPVYQPPPPPPINVKFFGYATRSGTKSIFLSQGDTVFTAHEGDIIAGRYKIVKINPTSVQITDVLSNNTQTIPLTQG